jgi:hypothetical protein
LLKVLKLILDPLDHDRIVSPLELLNLLELLAYTLITLHISLFFDVRCVPHVRVLILQGLLRLWIDRLILVSILLRDGRHVQSFSAM